MFACMKASASDSHLGDSGYVIVDPRSYNFCDKSRLTGMRACRVRKIQRQALADVESTVSSSSYLEADQYHSVRGSQESPHRVSKFPLARGSRTPLQDIISGASGNILAAAASITPTPPLKPHQQGLSLAPQRMRLGQVGRHQLAAARQHKAGVCGQVRHGQVHRWADRLAVSRRRTQTGKRLGAQGGRVRPFDTWGLGLVQRSCGAARPCQRV